jgi:hypothetical protein
MNTGILSISKEEAIINKLVVKNILVVIVKNKLK